MDLNGKRVLVTGGAVRIGRTLAFAFAGKGASVTVHCNSSKDEAIALLCELDKFSSGNEFISADLTDLYDIRQTIFPRLPETDILINNASVFHNGMLAEEDLAHAKTQFDINFWAPYIIMNEYKKQRGNKDSLIINFLDYRIKKPSVTDGTYLISKYALERLTELSAIQWAPSIRVNAIAPGFVIPPSNMVNSTMEKSLRKVPMGKAVPFEDIAKACIFIAEAESLTGQTIFLDGGASL
ncbi:MAG: SDR family oxidoreductase [Lentisphaerota bacterium]